MKAYYRVRTEYDLCGLASCAADGVCWTFGTPQCEVGEDGDVLIVRRYFENDADADRYIKGRSRHADRSVFQR